MKLEHTVLSPTSALLNAATQQTLQGDSSSDNLQREVKYISQLV